MATIILGGRGPHPHREHDYYFNDDFGEFGDDLEWAPPPMQRAVPPPITDVYREDEALDEENISDLGLGRKNGQKFGGMVAIGLGVGILVIFSLLLTRKQ